jgi:hypothetical protein
VLPFAKRQPRIKSESDLVNTGEIEIVDERLIRSTRPQLDRDPVTRPVTAVTLPRARVQAIRETRPLVSQPAPDSSTRIAVSKPSSRRLPPAPDSSARWDRRDSGRNDEMRNNRQPEMRTETLIPPSAPRPPEPSVDDEDMTRLLSYRPRYVAAPASSRRPAAQWAMAPVMTVEAEARSRVQPTTVPPPPSARSLSPAHPSPMTATTPSSRAPDSLRPVAMPTAADSGPHEPPPTSITMRTHVLHGRPTATWAAALVVLGVFVGLGSAVYARGDAAGIAASWFGSARTASANQPVADSFSQTQALTPASTPAPGAAGRITAPVVAAAPAIDRPLLEHATEPGAPSDPLAALMQAPVRGESAKAVSSRPTFVAPGSSYSPPPVHHYAAAARPAPSPPSAPPAAPASIALASASQDASPAMALAAPPPPPAPKATSKSRSSKKANDDDMQAASASDALARAQLEAALR